MALDLRDIPIINDHTHIFGTKEVPDFEEPGRYINELTPEGLIAELSGLNMNESSTVALEGDPKARERRFIELYAGRRSAFPIRAVTRLLHQEFDFAPDEITLENAAELIARMRRRVPTGTEALYRYFVGLTNTELYFCNHGNLSHLESHNPGTTRGLFRWVPYCFHDAATLNAVAAKLGLEPPQTEQAVREVMTRTLRRAKELGAVAVKGGAFAYAVNRPFAPDVRNLNRLAEAKSRLDRGAPDPGDAIIVADALAVITAQQAGEVGLPQQIHVGLIWSARDGPTRVPEIGALTPLFYACPQTIFVIFHAGYPRTDDLAYLATTVSNVRAEFNWAPFWAGLDFPQMIGKWIDMIPNDRMLYGTDASGWAAPAHDMITREGLAEALEARISRGYLSRSLAREVAANILRNNAIAVYGLNLPRYVV